MKPALVMDAEMRADAALERMALNGYWLDSQHPFVQRRLDTLKDSGRSTASLLRSLRRQAQACGVAVRCQWGARVLWHARELTEVLVACADADPAAPLHAVLALTEADGRPGLDLALGVPLRAGVVMLNGQPVGVSFRNVPDFLPPASASSDDRVPRSAGATGDSSSLSLSHRRAPPPTWPRIEAPSSARAETPFDVVVGFGTERQADVAGGALQWPPAVDRTMLRVTIELTAAEGLAAPEGWRRTVDVDLRDPRAAVATFRVVGTTPTNRERVWLTMLEVRYVVDGVVCGLAARPLMVLPQDAPPLGVEPGEAVAVSASPLDLTPDPDPPDLTLEISAAGGQAALGQYVCSMFSPHTLRTPLGPFPIQLGQDSATFARQIVDEVRAYAGSPLLDTFLEATGRRIAGRLPGVFFAALRELAQALGQAAVPSVLIVSREPYVPWELAWVEVPLDPARPRYLGAQFLVGRWLRDGGRDNGQDDTVLARPAAHPRSNMGVKHLAVMAAFYKATDGLRRLPKAEAEADALAASHTVLRLRATAQDMRGVLTATVRGADQQLIGGIDVLHFAGHGDFDTETPDGATLFLEGGPALHSTLFGAARYGGERQPFLFLNACMLGIGGDVLGDMGGFPGNSLRGGFGAVLGALWEVDDTVAHDIAVRFWQRVLPPPPARGEPVAAVLRDLRATYAPDASPSSESTWLSYVYYGHPRLTLQRTV